MNIYVKDIFCTWQEATIIVADLFQQFAMDHCNRDAIIKLLIELTITEDFQLSPGSVAIFLLKLSQHQVSQKIFVLFLLFFQERIIFSFQSATLLLICVLNHYNIINRDCFNRKFQHFFFVVFILCHKVVLECCF